MKKSIIIAAMMAVTFGASAQWFDFKSNLNLLEAGFQTGPVGLKTNYSQWGYGGSLNVCGVYIDFLYTAPEHKYDNHVLPLLYNDTAALAINIGYQIPILPWLRVMPLVGHCHTSAGLTDATTVNIEVEGESGRMYHDFDITSRRHYFNYGGGLIVQPFNWLSLYGVYTVHAIYGGISVNLGALYKDSL